VSHVLQPQLEEHAYVRIGQGVVRVATLSLDSDHAVGAEQAEGMRHRGFARVYDASDIVHGHGARQQGDQYAYPPGITEKAEYVGQVGNMRRVWHLCPHLLSVIGMIGSGRHLAVPPRTDVLHGSDDTPHSFAHTARGGSSNAIGSH